MNRQIYKMTLSDASDSITFYLLEVPIADDDITGTARNTTIDGNVYEDYLWLKKQWSQKWSIMCKDEYDKLRGIWKRQYTDSEVVSVKYFYGDNIYTDGEVEGNTMQINNDSEVYEGEIRGFSLYGNATQETLSGKNLLNKSAVAISGSGSVSQIADGFRVVDNSGGYGGKIVISNISPSTTYTLSFTMNMVANTSDARRAIVFKGTTTSSTYASKSASANGTYNVSFTTDAGETAVNIWFQDKTPSDGATTDWTFVQLEASSTATPYEPYVGCIPAPNPDFPQVVNTVSGAQTVKITGKNLQPTSWAQDFVDAVNLPNNASVETFDGKNCLSFQPNAGYGDYPNKNFTLGVNFRENTQYTISFDEHNTTSNRHVAFYYTDGTYSTYTATSANTWTRVSMTSTAGKTVAYVAPFYTSGTTHIDIDTFQIEEGTQATAYEPYQGQSYTIDLDTLELAKIGTYQDYIWNDGGTWKIHKDLGKVVLTGDASESWAYASGAHARFQYSNNTIALEPSPSAIGAVMSDHFTASSTNDIYQGIDGKIGVHATIHQFWLSYLAITDLNAFKTWLSTHPTTVYYALATPTDTEITDAELVGQLDALLAGSLYKGLNNVFLIPSAGAQGTMTLDYRIDYEKETVVQDTTPVLLDLTDDGIINACQCRQNVKITMRETVQ